MIISYVLYDQQIMRLWVMFYCPLVPGVYRDVKGSDNIDLYPQIDQERMKQTRTAFLELLSQNGMVECWHRRVQS